MSRQGFCQDPILPGKPSLKRRLGGSKVQDRDEPPLKMHIPRHGDRDDNRDMSMRRDIATIKKNIKDMGNMVDEMKEDIACIKESLEEISYEAREERDNINSMLADLLAEIQQLEKD
jgi:hypothetical protein